MKGYLLFLLLFTFWRISFSQSKIKIAIVISANIEWKATKKIFPNEKFLLPPWGEYFFKEFEKEKVLVFQEGWGKVA